ncbi:MAG: AraC family transcriptional regulator [Bacillota bacterium]|nr:AraC family transcriptional regulator [Bacillota bacterium]
MKKWYKEKMGKRYLFSYLVVSIIPVFLISLIYIIIGVTNFEQETNKSMSLQLDQIKNTIDYDIKDMESAIIHFSSNPELLKSYDQKNIDFISEQLANYKQNFPLSKEILYYKHGTAFVFTSEGIVDYKAFEEQNNLSEQFTMTNFFSKLNTITRSYLISIKQGYPNNTVAGNLIAYMQPIPYLDNDPSGTMAFLIDRQKITDIFENYIGDFKGYAFIYDNSLSTTYVYDNYKKLNIDTVSIKLGGLKGTEVGQVTIDGKKMITVRKVSENLGFSYVIAMPYNEFYKQVWKSFSLVSWLSIIFIFLLIGFAVMQAIRSYKPINALFHEMVGEEDEPFDEGTDVLERIRNSYSNVTTKNRELLVQVSKQSSFVREQFFKNLLLGRVSMDDNIQLATKRANVEFYGEKYFVVAVQLNQQSIVSDNTIEYINEIYLKSGKAYGVEMENEGKIAVIVNLTIDGSEEDIRYSTANSLKELFAQCGYTDMSLGVGNVYDDMLNLYVSYFEALTAVDNAKKNNENISLFVGDDDANSYIYPATERALFQQSLLHGNVDAALSALNKMIKNVEENSPSFLMTRCFCFYIINTIIEVCNNLETEVNESELAQVAVQNSLSEFHEKLSNLTRDICSNVRQTEVQQSRQRANDLIEYVNQHFSEYNMSIENMARHFELSERYLRRFFKDETGCNFMQYVTMLRFNFIKKNLISTDTPVKDIVQSAGYSDVANFIRKFKSIEGVTPGQFRELSKTLKS